MCTLPCSYPCASKRFSWQELGAAEWTEGDDEGVAGEESSLEFGIFASVWSLGQMSASEVLSTLSSSLFRARARLGIEVALAALVGRDEWRSEELAQLWELLDRR